LTFLDGNNAEKLHLDGSEVFSIEGLLDGAKEVIVKANKGGKDVSFKARVRIDTPKEWEYYKNGGILHYVLRQLAA
jgi:aconitate hydratase